MRVLEADPSMSYNMGKNRKHRIRKAKENEVEESSEDGAGCPHVSKAVNLAAMRKVIQKPTVTLGECSGCVKDGVKSSSRDLFGGLIEGLAPAESEDVEPAETTVCVCLQCGHQGCDRNSHNKHALKHYKTPHSGIHSIVVNLTTWTTWCYICDEEISQNPRIQGCIDFLQKQSGVSKPEPAPLTGRPLESSVAEAVPVFMNTPAGKNTSPVSCVKVKGLSNLGNTCFFNAVMQSLCQTKGLEALLIDRSKSDRLCPIAGTESSKETDSSSSDDDRDEEESVNIKLSSIQTVYGDPGPLTLALLNFVQEMRGGTTRNGTVNPIAFFTQVCKKAPRFKGFQQQDSHELLRYLIDCIRTEEIKRGQASILKFFKLPESISPKKVDEETKFKVKEYGRQVKHTFLDGLFGGHLVSTVKCEECKTVSQIFEAFLDLSLPVMEEKPQRPNLVLIGKKRDSVSLADTAEDGDVTTAASVMGLDACSEKPSKYQERKNKRMAKKDAKKKNKLQSSRSVEHHDNSGKVDHEESASLDQEAASEDSNKNENDNSSVDKDKGDDVPLGQPREASCSSDASQLKTFLPGRSGRSADSSPEGSKDGLGTNGDEERDDPSDADVEDNLEADMSRLDVSMATGNPHQTNTSCHDNHTLHCEDAADQTTHVRLGGSLLCTVTTHISNVEFTDSGQESHKDHDLTIHKEDSNLTIHKEDIIAAKSNEMSATKLSTFDRSSSDVLVNGELPSTDLVEERAASCVEARNRCQAGGAGDEVTSCQAVEVLHLTNSLDQLGLTDRTNQLVGFEAKELASAEIELGKPHLKKSSSRDFVPEVSATFNITLQSPASAERRLSADTIHVIGNFSHKETVDNDKQDAEKQVEEKHYGHQTRLKTRRDYLREARNYSMSTMSPRYHPAPKECSILSCLNQFTAAELLTGTNKFGCRECTKRRKNYSHPTKGDKKVKDPVYSNANKQYLIFRPPAVLTLHLKRFEQTGLTSRKVNHHVDFPLLLDLAPYCSTLCQGVKEGQTKVLYSLYGVVEHSGRLTGGHYTAYIKVRPGMSPHTQFMYPHAPGYNDLLNVYLTRVVKTKDGNLSWHDGACDKQDVGEVIDKDTEARAEALLPPGRWYHISDSRVNEVAEAEVLKAQAYLLFYERIF